MILEPDLALVEMKNPNPSRLNLSIICGADGDCENLWLTQQLLDGAFANSLVLLEEGQFEKGLGRVPGFRQMTLSKGCVCCAGGTHEVVASLLDAVTKRNRFIEPYDRIALLAGKRTDPARVAQSVQSNPVLSSQLRVSEIVIVLDAGKVAVTLQDDPFFASQVDAADCVVLLGNARHQDNETQKAIEAMRPGIPVYWTEIEATHAATADS